MRTTVTLDPDVADIIERAMSERKLSFKAALNDAIRAGARIDEPEEEPFVQKTHSMGVPLVDLTHALSLAADLEDEEIIRKMELGK